jgi:hypothetical protein
MSKVWFSVVLGTAALFGLPGISSAQHGGMHGGGLRPGSSTITWTGGSLTRFGRFGRDFDRRFDFNRRFFDPRFRGFFDPRFNRFEDRFGFGRFDRFEDRVERRFHRGFVDPRFTPGFFPGFVLPF